MISQSIAQRPTTSRTSSGEIVTYSQPSLRNLWGNDRRTKSHFGLELMLQPLVSVAVLCQMLSRFRLHTPTMWLISGCMKWIHHWPGPLFRASTLLGVNLLSFMRDICQHGKLRRACQLRGLQFNRDYAIRRKSPMRSTTHLGVTQHMRLEMQLSAHNSFAFASQSWRAGNVGRWSLAHHSKFWLGQHKRGSRQDLLIDRCKYALYLDPHRHSPKDLKGSRPAAMSETTRNWLWSLGNSCLLPTTQLRLLQCNAHCSGDRVFGSTGVKRAQVGHSISRCRFPQLVL